jgi:hypothetical protein
VLIGGWSNLKLLNVTMIIIVRSYYQSDVAASVIELTSKHSMKHCLS